MRDETLASQREREIERERERGFVELERGFFITNQSLERDRETDRDRERGGEEIHNFGVTNFIYIYIYTLRLKKIK